MGRCLAAAIIQEGGFTKIMFWGLLQAPDHTTATYLPNGKSILGHLLSLLFLPGEVAQSHPHEEPLQPKYVPSAQPGQTTPHLVPPVPPPPRQVLQAFLQAAAAAPSPGSRALQEHLVPASPIAQL